MDSILDPACRGLISPQSYCTLFSPLSRRCPFQDKHKQKNLCILKTDINLSLPIFPAIKGNHYVIDRHGYPPYFFFFLWMMDEWMDKSMLILISLWHRLISSRLYSVTTNNVIGRWLEDRYWLVYKIPAVTSNFKVFLKLNHECFLLISFILCLEIYLSRTMVHVFKIALIDMNGGKSSVHYQYHTTWPLLLMLLVSNVTTTCRASGAMTWM